MQDNTTDFQNPSDADLSYVFMVVQMANHTNLLILGQIVRGGGAAGSRSGGVVILKLLQK